VDKFEFLPRWGFGGQGNIEADDEKILSVSGRIRSCLFTIAAVSPQN